MLAAMRSKSRLIMGIIIVPISLAFVAFFGMSGISNDQARKAMVMAHVNGQAITRDQFSLIRTQYERQARNSNQPIDADQIDLLAWKDIVRNELMRQAADKMGVVVTQEDIDTYVRSMFVGEDGQFNELWFQRWYSENFHMPDEFYFLYGNVLRQERIGQILRSQSKVSEAELKDAYARSSDKREIQWVQWNVSDYLAKVQDDPAGILAFYEAHKERYRLPDQIKVCETSVVPQDVFEYVTVSGQDITRQFEANKQSYEQPATAWIDYTVFSPKDLEGQARATITDASIAEYYGNMQEELKTPERYRLRLLALDIRAAGRAALTEASIEAFYQENRQRLYKPERARISRILRKVPAGCDDQTRDQILKELADLVADVTGVEQFAALAREHSQDSHAAEGGDLGWQDRHTANGRMENEAYALEPGQISKPFITSEGAQVVMLQAREEDGIKTLEEARKDLLEMLEMETGRKVSEAALKPVLTELAGVGLAAATANAAAVGARIVETDWISAEDEIAGVSPEDLKSICSAATLLEPGKMGQDLVRGTAGCFAVELIDKAPPQPRTMEEARGDIIERLTKQMSEALAQTQAEAFAAVLRGSSETFSKLAAASNLSASESDAIYQNVGKLDGLGYLPRKWGDDVLALAVGAVGGPELRDPGYVVFRVRKKDEARLPELGEIQARVRYDARTKKANRLAERLQERVLNQLDVGNFHLQDAAIAVVSEGTQVRAAIEAGQESETWPTEEAQAMKSLKVVETDWFAPGEAPTGKNWGQVVRNYIKEMKRLREPPTTLVNDVPQSAQGGQDRVDGVYMFELVARRDSHIPAFDDVKEQATKDWKMVEAARFASQQAEKAATQLGAAIAAWPADATGPFNLEQWATPAGLEYHAPQAVQNTGYVPGIGQAQSVTTTAFALDEGQISGLVPAARLVREGDQQVEEVQNYVILQVTKINQGTDFDAQREELRKQMVSGRSNAIYEAWLDSLRNGADIQISEDWEPELQRLRGEKPAAEQVESATDES
jgi:parvulin-like peptidyl-prolyl isomerase